MDLKQRFEALWAYWEADKSKVETLWTELTDKYNEPHRYYHNLEHLRELFSYYNDYYGKLANPQEVAFAIFYHDIIYDIWSKKNELKSAELAKRHLESYQVNDNNIIRIFDLIMVTKDHTPKQNSDEKWIIDFDLGVLGQSWDRYHAYTRKIRKEYGAVPSFIYRKGRKKVLEHFLEKEYVYKTDVFRSRFEIKARNNIKKELEIL